MATRFKQLVCGAAIMIVSLPATQAQLSSPTPAVPSKAPDVVQAAAPAPAVLAKPTSSSPTLPTGKSTDSSGLLLVQASTAPAATAGPGTQKTTTTSTTSAPATVGAAPVAGTETDSVTENGGVGVREFQGDDVGQVLRLLARQAKVNMVVSEAVQGTVTMRLEDVTALQAIEIIAKAKGLFLDKLDSVYYIKTVAERTAEPTESDSYQFSYARAKDIVTVVAPQLSSKDAMQIDERTNTIFFRETRGNIDNIRKLLAQIDKPTKQVMIEARLVEVTANPKQAYGINWGGVVGGPTNPQTIKFAGSDPAEAPSYQTTVNPVTGQTSVVTTPGKPAQGTSVGGKLVGSDFFLSKGLSSLAGQFAILSVPQMSVTIQALNEDADAEFLANPRVVTADNQKATIEISRAQPVAKLQFNNQTASSEFSGFEDKKFGNKLEVLPSVNKDNFITLNVKPEISNKVGDQVFTSPGGGSVASPIIDTRTLNSNVLIKSGDTLAIGGLMQDEIIKSRTKVPVMGDVPVLGYLFQSRNNARVKRNLLVFVTPTIIDQKYGTGLEDQVTGLHHTGEEYADPNGWRNNAKGAVRVVPTAHRQVAADYPVPGIPPAPANSGGSARKTRFMTSAKDRDF